LKKNGAILNQSGFCGLKNSFAHSILILETNSKPLKEDSSTADNHFESDSSSYKIFLRVSIFETKWFDTISFFFSIVVGMRARSVAKEVKKSEFEIWSLQISSFQ
jgi:hypothetical protein